MLNQAKLFFKSRTGILCLTVGILALAIGSAIPVLAANVVEVIPNNPPAQENPAPAAVVNPQTSNNNPNTVETQTNTPTQAPANNPVNPESPLNQAPAQSPCK